MRNITIRTVVLLVLLVTTAMAMNGQIKITGTVVDEFDSPIEFASVRITGKVGVESRFEHARGGSPLSSQAPALEEVR